MGADGSVYVVGGDNAPDKAIWEYDPSINDFRRILGGAAGIRISASSHGPTVANSALQIWTTDPKFIH